MMGCVQLYSRNHLVVHVHYDLIGFFVTSHAGNSGCISILCCLPALLFHAFETIFIFEQKSSFFNNFILSMVILK